MGTFEQGHRLTVQGDLNESELSDVQSALTNLSKMMNDASAGKMDRAASRNSSFANWDELAAVDSDILHSYIPAEQSDSKNSSKNVIDFSSMKLPNIEDMTKEECEEAIADMIDSLKQAGVDPATIKDVIDEVFTKQQVGATPDQQSILQQAAAGLSDYVDTLYNAPTVHVSA